jgi:16S rRNA (cytidine1402-2'-O)-methyltransferase
MAQPHKSPGTVYIVATPIGNLEDFSPRAQRIMAEADVIAAEDTRHTSNLCRHFGIEGKLVSMHDFNESARVAELLQRVVQGESVAVVSDAGTPLISDPGYLLVKAAHQKGLAVSPLPGPCAAIAALSVAGLPAHRFAFEGFLPAKKGGRLSRLKKLALEVRTMVFYESPHRIRDLLDDLSCVFSERSVVVAREITKVFETILTGTASEIAQRMDQDANQLKGEFVVMVAGYAAEDRREETSLDIDKLLGALIIELPISKAAGIVADVSGFSKKELYARAVAIKNESGI